MICGKRYPGVLRSGAVSSLSSCRVFQCLAVLLSLAFVRSGFSAGKVVFPAHACIKNAVTDFGAAGNGTTDDTQALTRAFGIGNTALLYIPNGTYRVTASILAKSVSRGPWVYGQSRDGVVIRLDDNAPGFGNPAVPQPVLAAHSIPAGGAISADLFFRQWHNFTVDAGNNAGAIGIRYYSNNSGVLDNVRIRGNGAYGLDLGWTNMNGPCIIRSVVVEGFETGVYTSHGINSQTMYDVMIRDSRKSGMSATGQNLSIEGIGKGHDGTDRCAYLQ